LRTSFGNRIGCVGDVADISDLATSTSLGYRNRILQLGGIYSDERLPTFPHGSSPVR
jgi:hypothetical protein